MRLLLAAFVAFTAHAQVSSFELRSLPSLGNARALLIASDRARNTFILSASKPLTGTGRLRVTKLDPKGTQVAFYEFGDAVTDIPYAVTTDSDGNFVVVGGTKSKSFPIVSPLPGVASVNSPYIFTMAFISIVDASLTKLVFSATLAGTEPGPLCGIFTNTVATAVAAMPDGKITVVGTTCAKDFPVTQNAFQKSGPGYDLFYTALSYAFVTTILPSAPSILYSTYYGTSGPVLDCFTYCDSPVATTAASAVAVTPDGSIVVAGSVHANPVATPGTVGIECFCEVDDNTSGFLIKIAPDGTLAWSTSITRNPNRVVQSPQATKQFSALTIKSLAVDPSGNLILAGSTSEPILSKGSEVQPEFPAFAGQFNPNSTSTAGFIVKLDPDATRYLFATHFGRGAVQSAVLDSGGNIWATGTADATLPLPAGTPYVGNSYVARLSRDATRVEYALTAPAGSTGQALAVANDDSVTALGSSGALLLSSPTAAPTLTGIVNSAATSAWNYVAPDELISIYGVGIGPAIPTSAQFASPLSIAKKLAGYQVLFDGTPAALLYASANQINAVVPDGVQFRDTTEIWIVSPTGTVRGPTMAVVPAAIAVFPVVINPDGTVNSSLNPAPPNGIVSVWGTGAGATGLPDGTLYPTPQSIPQPVSVINRNSVYVQYAGGAHGLVSGAFQVNFQVPFAPLTTTPYSFALEVPGGTFGSVSPNFVVSVKGAP